MIIKSKGKLSSEAAATIILALCEIYNVTIEEATNIFYQSETSLLIDEGVADLHCRSPKYLAQCIWDEYRENNSLQKNPA